jgi:hypothetical protein
MFCLKVFSMFYLTVLIISALIERSVDH